MLISGFDSKRRCDARKPSCSNCMEMEVDCQYDDQPSQRCVMREYKYLGDTEQLQDRYVGWHARDHQPTSRHRSTPGEPGRKDRIVIRQCPCAHVSRPERDFTTEPIVNGNDGYPRRRWRPLHPLALHRTGASIRNAEFTPVDDSSKAQDVI